MNKKGKNRARIGGEVGSGRKNGEDGYFLKEMLLVRGYLEGNKRVKGYEI